MYECHVCIGLHICLKRLFSAWILVEIFKTNLVETLTWMCFCACMCVSAYVTVVISNKCRPDVLFLAKLFIPH